MIVVAALLEKGDIIKRFGVEHVVVAVDETHVYYTAKSSYRANGFKMKYMSQIGIKSKERIELIEPPKPEPPKEEVKFTRIKGKYSNTTPFGIKK